MGGLRYNDNDELSDRAIVWQKNPEIGVLLQLDNFFSLDMMASTNGHVDEIFSCLFVNDSNARFGGLQRAVCLDVELQKDLHSVVFNLLL